MWFWEVIYTDEKGMHSLFALQGMKTAEAAKMLYEASQFRIMEELQKRKATLVDVQIIYKSSGKLYTDGQVL